MFVALICWITLFGINLPSLNRTFVEKRRYLWWRENKMDFFNLIKNSNLSDKQFALIIAVNIIIAELNKNESTKVTDRDFFDLMRLSHDFYFGDRSKQREYQKKIVLIIAYNFRIIDRIGEVEVEIFKLTGIDN